MSQQPTEGQRRVRVSFNPNQLPIVELIKSQTATLIDTLQEYGKEVVANTSNVEGKKVEQGDFMREINTAKTAIQEASMWAVAAVTNDYSMDATKGKVADSMQPDRWVSYKEWEAYQHYKSLNLGNRPETEV